jgi:phosphoribosyl 1,2-cyclic phosphodiesterase
MTPATASSSAFTITYWGTTGALPAPLRPDEVTDKIVQALTHLLRDGHLNGLHPGHDNATTARRLVEENLPFAARSTFGGNTTCVQVEPADALIILDCGSGLHELGLALASEWNAPDYAGPRTGHVLLTHPHMDHTFAIPLVSLFFDPRNHFSMRGTKSVLKSLGAVLDARSPLSHTFFPPTYDMMKALRDFHMVEPGDVFQIGGTVVRTHPLNHPGGCLAYRLENAGRSFVFATDHEPLEVPDRGLATFADGADVLYMVGQYLTAEYEGREPIPGTMVLGRQGWGHGSVQACVATAALAGVRWLHIGHREPIRSDAQLEQIESYAQALMRETLQRQGRGENECLVSIPFEGMTVGI